ncbi:MAG: hypothetical protein ACKE51_01870 [Methylococcaceae bacterium]
MLTYFVLQWHIVAGLYDELIHLYKSTVYISNNLHVEQILFIIFIIFCELYSKEYKNTLVECYHKLSGFVLILNS